LEEEIHGSGITNCTYGNLCGGESRSIDIALQLAFLDIKKNMAGIYPDVVVFDEILDSSVDSAGISNLMRILQTLQREEQNKTFLITHRSEVTDIDIDNLYIVEKRDGFSSVRRV
jgi:energy-coupling factor transporter ATP-binding protein EcfA2